jgi:hypothetical protein
MWISGTLVHPLAALFLRPFRPLRRDYVSVHCTKQGSLERPQEAWSLVNYFTKKERKVVDEFGNVDQSPHLVRDPLRWTHLDTKLELAVVAVARELDVKVSAYSGPSMGRLRSACSA